MSLSLKTLPLLFINLGGEMMYILDQRLKAQNIQLEKSKKVLHDITITMFNKRFMDDMFKPQELYSKKALRTVFDRLAHASIMRLNSASMDKLYDLMTMALKYQVSLAVSPKDIMLLTLNHMDAIREFACENEQATGQVNRVFDLLSKTFGSLSNGEWMLIRQTLLSFFQDLHIRVSIFLKNELQSSNGRFMLPTEGPVVYHGEEPGSIRIYRDDGVRWTTKTFSPNSSFGPPKEEGSLELWGDRIITLGTNMYSSIQSLQATTPKYTQLVTESVVQNSHAKAQLDLLSQLIGKGADMKTTGPEFRLNLFDNDEEEQEANEATISAQAKSQCINIDATHTSESVELNRIRGELREVPSLGADDDLLDLMDSAN